MGEHKPLPAVPGPPSTFIIPTTNNSNSNARVNEDDKYSYTKLSLNARTHRSALIRFALSECAGGDAWVESNEEELVTLLEDVLDELGEYVETGKWLSGVKRRVMLRARNGNYAHAHAHGSTAKDVDVDVLDQLRELAAKPDLPSRVPTCKRVVLCVAPLGSRVALPEEEEEGFDIVPANIGCTFRTGCFVLDDEESVLFGLEGWDPSIPTRLVGGTFTFKGLPSPTQHRILCKTLKVGVYTHLSLLLEQHLLVDSNVKLTFSKPRVRTRTISSSVSNSSSNANVNQSNVVGKRNKKADSHSILPNRILGFFAKRGLGRTNSVGPGSSGSRSSNSSSTVEEAQKGGSLDLERSISHPHSHAHAHTHIHSDAVARLRKLSFIPSSSSSTSSSHTSNSNTSAPTPISPSISTPTPSSISHPTLAGSSLPFTATLSTLESQKSLLSTSAGVEFEPPIVLVKIAERERRGAAATTATNATNAATHATHAISTGMGTSLGLLGDERSALSSLLGWGVPAVTSTLTGERKRELEKGFGETKVDRVDRAKGMIGLEAFVRHQQISVLVSSHVPLGLGSNVTGQVQFGPEASLSASSSSTLSYHPPHTHTPIYNQTVANAPTHALSSSSSSSGSGTSDQPDSSISFPPASAPTPTPTHTACEAPVWVTYRYWRYGCGSGSGSRPCQGDGHGHGTGGAHGRGGGGRGGWWGRSEGEVEMSGSTDTDGDDTGTDTETEAEEEKDNGMGSETETETEGVRYHRVNRKIKGNSGRKRGKWLEPKDMCLGEVLREWIDSAEEECGNLRVIPPLLPSVVSGEGKDGKDGRKEREKDDGRKEKERERGGTPVPMDMSGSSVLGAVDTVKGTKPSQSQSLLPPPLPHPRPPSPKPHLQPQPQIQIQQGPGGKKLMRCVVKKGKHERRFVHGGVRICATLQEIGEVEEVVEGGVKGEEEVREGEREGMEKTTKASASTISAAGSASTTGSSSSTIHFSTSNPTDTDFTNNLFTLPDPNLRTYTTCSICGSRTPERFLSDGAYLFSWGKFLEVLVYSGEVGVLEARSSEASEAGSFKEGGEGLCVHTCTKRKDEDGRTGEGGRGKERFNILRHFVGLASCLEGPEVKNKKGIRRRKEYRITISLAPVEDIFEIRVPRVQLDPLRGLGSGYTMGTAAGEVESKQGMREAAAAAAAVAAEDEKRKLRREIRDWWEGVGGFLDGLEDRLALSTSTRSESEALSEAEASCDTDTAKARRKKKLPRLPSVDDYADEVEDDVLAPPLTPTQATPKASGFADLGAIPNPDAGVNTNSNSNANMSAPIQGQGTGIGMGIRMRMGLGLGRKISGLPEASSTPMVRDATRDYFPPAPGSSGRVSEGDGSVTPRAGSVLGSSEMLTSSMATDISSSSSSSASASTSSVSPLQLLSTLRETLNATEQSLYTQLARTPVGSLNEVRRAFLCAAKGVERRLDAWERKHFGKGKDKDKTDKGKGRMRLCASEPEWWDKACHVVPGGNIIVREDDWGSIIAFTLSTHDYHRELASMSITRTTSTSSSSSTPSPPAPLPVNTPAVSIPVTTSTSSSTSSFLSAATATGYKLFRPSASASSLSLSSTSSSNVMQDPDAPDVIWQTEPESYSAVITRKEHPRDPTSLLSIREVLRQKSPSIGLSDVAGTGILSGSRFVSLGKETSRLLRGGTPPSAWAKPDVAISREAVEGEVGGVDGGGEKEATSMAAAADKILHDMEGVRTSAEGSEKGPKTSGSTMSSVYSWTTAASAGEDREESTRRDKGVSECSMDSDVTVGPRRHDDAPEPPPKDDSYSTVSPPPTPSKGIHKKEILSPVPAKSSFGSLTSGITNAMRLVLPLPGGVSNNSDPPRPQSASAKHHGLLSTIDVAPVDERPHIKYDWTIGKRMKFSCTVYYAKQFDLLRKRCGIDEVFLKSLSRSTNWSAEGGKSKSNFWKTADDRFIIKTLVNAWNVADLQVLIELGPSYFRYIDSTANRASVLAKLVGFYTVEVRNLETGNVQSKADLLVMENLFYGQKVDKTFDLKGIQGRRVKAGANASGQTSKTLFDGEWIEGQQQTLTLVRPYSKVVLREAIRSDADFLARSNIMDYSLLLGVDTKRKQIACGLVDTIGSYTFAKTLEYKAKQGLNSGREVTVIPPAEYQERFVGALEKYFLACPDKWSRPLDDSKVISDSDLLSSVL